MSDRELELIVKRVRYRFRSGACSGCDRRFKGEAWSLTVAELDLKRVVCLVCAPDAQAAQGLAQAWGQMIVALAHRAKGVGR